MFFILLVQANVYEQAYLSVVKDATLIKLVKSLSIVRIVGVHLKSYLVITKPRHDLHNFSSVNVIFNLNVQVNFPQSCARFKQK